MAEGILRQKILENKLNWTVDSAGTADYHVGEAPDERAIRKMEEYNIDISMLTGRQFNRKDFDQFDRIFTMDRENYDNVLSLTRNGQDSEKVSMILDLAYPNEERSVPDPYWNNDGFEEVYQMLNEACNKLIEKYS